MTSFNPKNYCIFDVILHDMFVFISGHSIKHILTAIALYILIKGYQVKAAPRNKFNTTPKDSLII